ncbi:MAG: hypothetical protein IJC04_09655 [Oscillospiraceae bacterium]|nr:hypothetical protein [Oscillospiraceae bacterium]
MKKSRILSAIAAAAIAATTFVSMAVPASAADSYHAYLGVQEPTGWSFRNAWYEPTYGLGVTADDGMVFFDQITGWDGSTPLDKGGDFTDAEITGDGTYKVSLTGDFDFGAAEALSLLFVSTDIPLDAGVSVTDVKVILDGNTKYTFDEAFQDPDDKTYVHPLCINQWNSDINELFGYVMPTSSIEIEFTVSGIDALLAGGAADTAEAETTAPTTGNVPAAVMLSVMAVAGTAAVVSKKRN